MNNERAWELLDELRNLRGGRRAIDRWVALLPADEQRELQILASMMDQTRRGGPTISRPLTLSLYDKLLK